MSKLQPTQDTFDVCAKNEDKLCLLYQNNGRQQEVHGVIVAQTYDQLVLMNDDLKMQKVPKCQVLSMTVINDGGCSCGHEH